MLLPQAPGDLRRASALVGSWSSSRAGLPHACGRSRRRSSSSALVLPARPCSSSAHAGQRRAPLGRASGPLAVPAVRAREARARRLGSRRTSRAASRRETLDGALAPDRPRSPASSAALILLEPDLGTAIALVVMLAAMLLVAGHARADARRRLRDRRASLGLLAIWLEPYRRARLFSFLNPWQDPQGAGFQIVQAHDRPRLRRHLRRRPRPGRPEDPSTCPRRTRT